MGSQALEGWLTIAKGTRLLMMAGTTRPGGRKGGREGGRGREVRMFYFYRCC